MINPLPAPEYPNRNYRPNDTAETRLKETLFIVEATGNEVQQFWSRYAREARFGYTNALREMVDFLECNYRDNPSGLCLEKSYLKGIDDSVKRFGPLSERAYDWKQISPGWLVRVGEVYRQPVNIEVQWVEIDGFLVCFYDACSRMVNHKFVEAWLKEHFTGTYDNGSRRASCDSSNFHHCIQAIDEAKKKKAVA